MAACAIASCGARRPSNVRNHFNVDPTKASFYAMDAYRTLHGRERMADAMADTVIATSTRPDGTVISPMRLAEAQLTKAVLAARDGSPVTALELAGAALNHERRSQPSLLLVASEVAHELEYRSPADGAEFRNHLVLSAHPTARPVDQAVRSSLNSCFCSTCSTSLAG